MNTKCHLSIKINAPIADYVKGIVHTHHEPHACLGKPQTADHILRDRMRHFDPDQHHALQRHRAGVRHRGILRLYSHTVGDILYLLRPEYPANQQFRHIQKRFCPDPAGGSDPDPALPDQNGPRMAGAVQKDADPGGVGWSLSLHTRSCQADFHRRSKTDPEKMKP